MDMIYIFLVSIENLIISIKRVPKISTDISYRATFLYKENTQM